MIVKVFVLVLYMSGGRDGGPTVIDNIATKEMCVALANELKTEVVRVRSAKCYPVAKRIAP